MGLCVAGRVVDDPMSIWREYARKHDRTVLDYDFGGRGCPYRVTIEEARRIKIIEPRISDTECERIVARAAEPKCPWRNVHHDDDLARADPNISGGLFDKAAELYWYFTARRIKGVRVTRTHKALHIKRPDMYPILDDLLRTLYRDRAELWVRKLPGMDVTTDDSPPYWAAIRQDLLGNEAELDDYRCQLATDADELVRRIANLGKLRLLDIIAWRIAGGN
jgi:hypothetical protein